MKALFYGGTGQCKVMRAIVGYSNLYVVIDDTENLKSPFKDVLFYSGKGAFDRWLKDTPGHIEYKFAITIGNPHGEIRQNLYKKLMSCGMDPLYLIHKSAIIDDNVCIGYGPQIHAGVIINPNANIMNCCIINTGAIVEHDCILNNGVEIGPRAVLCGEVEVGENTWVGAGATIKQKIKIGKNVIVGAGAVVVKDVPDNLVVVGVPARPLKTNEV